MQVKHLLILVILILLIPPGFYWLMNTTSAPSTPTLPAPLKYEVVKTGSDGVSVKIVDEGSAVESPYYDQFTEQLEAVPNWLVQDANFQGCVTKAVENCVSDVTQKEVQLLQSDTLCDALRGPDAESCKNQFNYTKAIKTKDIALCEKISNDFQAQACRNGVFTQKALESQNPRWCDKVTSAAGPATSSLVSPEKQNCLNLLDLQKGAADTSFLNNDWGEGLEEAVLD